MTVSKSSALSINVLLIFDMHDLNGELFLNVATFSALIISFATSPVKSIFPFTTIYSLLWSQI